MTSDGSQNSEELATHLTKSPLRFGFDDGKITNICSAEHEEDWVLNFKRGVLSSFQNSMEELAKEDVSWICLILFFNLDELFVVRTNES